MKATEIAKKLGVNKKYVRKYSGVFRYHQSYFWGIDKDASTLIAMVQEKIPNAKIIDSGNHCHPFVGGAKSGSAKDSYLWVSFILGKSE